MYIYYIRQYVSWNSIRLPSERRVLLYIPFTVKRALSNSGAKHYSLINTEQNDQNTLFKDPLCISNLKKSLGKELNTTVSIINPSSVFSSGRQLIHKAYFYMVKISAHGPIHFGPIQTME